MCYSTESFGKAYGFNIWPCSDQSLWEKTNGIEILPPVYAKKVGRPPKSRRKQPYEVQGKNGHQMSRHGRVMHCRHCGGSGHNSGGCKLKKQGISEAAKEMVAASEQASQEHVHETHDVITQDVIEQDPVGSQPMTELHSTLLSEMMEQVSQSSMLSQPQGPLPDPEFIVTNRPIARPAPLTTSTKEGQAAAVKKRKITKNNGPATNKKKAGARVNKKQAADAAQANAT